MTWQGFIGGIGLLLLLTALFAVYASPLMALYLDSWSLC